MCSFPLLVIRYKAQDGVFAIISGVGTVAILFLVQTSLYSYLVSLTGGQKLWGQESPSTEYSGNKSLYSSAPLGLTSPT